MALRNQPYFPLYVQDFMTDEKLNECSAQSAGVYIRLMCIMHKSDEYGTILLKQKYKQNNNFADDLPTILPRQNSQQILFFAEQLSKQMPYSEKIIAESLTELINEKVVILENETLIQKRMVKDNYISEKRSSAGSKGAKTTNSKNKKDTFADSVADSFAAAKPAANSEYEIEYENETVIENNNSLNIKAEENFQKCDPYDFSNNEKYFKLYELNCPQLQKINFERRDGKTLIALATFREVIKDNLEYFQEVCKKANDLVYIADNKIDFRSVLNNHIGIYGDKYKKTIKTETASGESSFETLARELEEEGY